MLGRSCSCTTDPRWLSGPAMPLVWEPEMEKAVEDELGFDPQNPDALKSIAEVLAGGAGLRSLEDVGFGYRERVIEAPTDRGESAFEDAAVVSVAGEGFDGGARPKIDVISGSLDTDVAEILALVLGAAFLLLAAGTVVILRMKAARQSR